MDTLDLNVPVSKLPRVNENCAKRLNRLGIKTVKDLLFYFPSRYDDFTNVKKIADLEAGEIATVRGKISAIKNIRTWKKKMNITEAVVSDESGSIRAIWFNQPYLADTLKPGDLINLSGKIVVQKSELYFSHPVCEIARGGKETNHTGRLVPVYSETEGLTSRRLRFIIKPLLGLAETVPEYLPAEMKTRKNLPDLAEALREIHFPENAASAERAKNRFAFEELFFLQLRALAAKQKLKKERAPEIPADIAALKKFVAALPFKLTDAQRKAAWEIITDLAKSSPMNRLLNGDVGSGKTVVAALAAFSCGVNGRQTAFMAPTEILANQHFEEISKLYGKIGGIKIGLLTAKTAKLGEKEIKKSELLEKTENGEIGIVIGTHSLIQKNVKFKNLALVVVDEQHRFGVSQRAALLSGKTAGVPHFLSMTATPIPRTLALTVFGDLDISVLDELPKGRRKTITKVVSPEERAAAYDFIKSEIKKGRQAFVICPRIEINKEGGEKASAKKLLWAEVKAVKDEHKKLSEKIFPDLKIGMLHGKLKTEEKEKTLKDFKNKKTDVLVATSVVEVGIDVPNATVMMIENADRFGLAQLHQFRGRVGRREHQSYCLLFSDSSSGENNRRLKAMVNCDNGFELARKDLEIRGPGSLFGGRQWGIPDLAMASLSDINLVKDAREEAEQTLKNDPLLKKHSLLREKISDFAKSVHLE